MINNQTTRERTQRASGRESTDIDSERRDRKYITYRRKSIPLKCRDDGETGQALAKIIMMIQIEERISTYQIFQRAV
jgi:hypothetical protein